jgi:hypothetical protein
MDSGHIQEEDAGFVSRRNLKKVSLPLHRCIRRRMQPW